MKKKVRVKSLPKAQNGFNNLPAPNVLRPDYLATWQKNNPYPAFGNAPASGPITADVYKGDPNTTGSFNVGMPEFVETKKGVPSVFNNNTTPFDNPFSINDSNFIFNTRRPPASGEFVKPMGMGPIGADDYYANVAQQNIASPAGTRFDKDFAYAPGTAMPSDLVKKPKQQKGNQFLAPALLATTDVFSSVARKFQNRDAKRDLKDQFLSDNLYTSRPEDYSGNRGDYTVNTPGFGDYFRPDEHVYGDYNKIARMGGEMKRKIKITSLPQAAYGGTQNTKAVNQLYGNSSYMTSMFNGTNEDESEEQYNQTLNADPRSTAVLEAEKGETLVRKGTNDVIPQFFKIGGKRHSEGGTPLSGEKATPDSFIYSDTKAMKIKDPAILESFGFAAKKGGYTPARISKKFDLNSKELREGLYSQNDPLRKSTSVLMADNYISNLGKLALVQESQKGFPQGIPQIAMPYMDKIGLDPTQFLPPSPQEGMAMAMYGGIPKAQIGQSVNPGGISNVSIDNLPQYEIDWLKFKQRANDPNQSLPSTQEYMAAQKAYNDAKINNSSMLNPMNWGSAINYGLTGQFENMGDSYSKYNGEGPMTTAIRYGTDPMFMATAAAPVGKVLGAVGKRLGAMEVGSPVVNFLKTGSVPNILEASGIALKDIPSNLASIADLTIPYIQKLAAPTALLLLINSNNSDQSLTSQQQVELLKKLDTAQVNELMESPVSSKISSDSLIEASKENPNIDVARIPEITIKAKPSIQTPKPKVNIAKPSTGFTAPDSSRIVFEYGGESLYQGGGEKGTFLGKHTDNSGNQYISYLQGDKVVLMDSSNTVVSSRVATEKDKPAIQTYDAEEEKLLKSIAPNLILPKDYVEGNQTAEVAKIPGTFGRFDKPSADKNWSWYGKPIDWTNEVEVGTAQFAYNKEMYNRFIKAGYTPKEAARYVKTIGFDESQSSGIPNAYDKKAGKYTETRIVFDVPKKPTTPDTPRDPLDPGELTPPPIRRTIGFYPQDVLNTAAAVGDLASINKYNPRMVQFNPQPMKPTYYDPNRELANNAEMVNIAAQNLAQFTGPQAFNSRFSEVQGKGLANAANIESRYNNLNVGVANQFEQANKQLMNDGNFRNQLAANDFYDKTVTANQQFDNARRQGRREVVDYTNAALDNRFITDQMNSLYPNYFVDPAMLKTYYNQTQQLPAKQQGQDMMTYLKATNIPFDFTDPAVQAALLKGIMGDVNVDERGNIGAAQARMSRRRGKTS